MKQIQSWITAIYDAFSIVKAPKRRNLVEIELLVSKLSKTISQSMDSNSSKVLSNLSTVYKKSYRTLLKKQKRAYMSMTINGTLSVHFETGSEGSSWMVLEDDKTGWDGAHYIRNGDHLKVEITSDGISVVLLDKKLEMLNTASALKHAYLKQYVKAHETGLKQLSFAGMWMHYLPVNVDLGLWYRIFYELNDTQALKATLTRS